MIGNQFSFPGFNIQNIEENFPRLRELAANLEAQDNEGDDALLADMEDRNTTVT